MFNQEMMLIGRKKESIALTVVYRGSESTWYSYSLNGQEIYFSPQNPILIQTPPNFVYVTKDSWRLHPNTIVSENVDISDQFDYFLIDVVDKTKPARYEFS